LADLFSKILEIDSHPDALKLLLNWLNPDLELAEKTYLELRKKIIYYFQSQGCLDSEDCADVVFLRVGQKLLNGTKIETQQPYEYVRGVARFVLMEYWRDRKEIVEPLDELPLTKHPSINPVSIEQEQTEELKKEQMLKCLASCLEQLPRESYQIFIEYHQDKNSTKIDGRLSLSQRLGIDITTLRNRITRIRSKLEKCISNCLEQQNRNKV